MNPERLRQIEELYHAAMERASGDREAFMQEACGSDGELLRAVSSLVEQDPAGDPMERPILQVAANLLSDLGNTPWTPGTLVGPYQIVSRLGAGGMGEVFQARDTRLGRNVAIKVAHEEFGGRFQREARAISALNHPKICTLYDIGPNYLVMELVEGETLANRLRKKPLPMELVLRYGAEIAGAIAAAHSKGITHRDLKPGNIMITKAGIKVLDFGLAKVAPGGEVDDTLTDSQTILGTPAYMAPEQLEGKPCDARTDIFALGVVLHEMATGKPPFAGDSKAALIADILLREPDLSMLSPAPFAHVVRRCLAKEAEDRWQSVRDIQFELEYLLESPAVTPAPTRKRRLWIAGAAATTLTSVAVILWLAGSSPTEPAVVPLTSYPGSERQPSISPDGNQVAFVWDGGSGGNFDIYVKQIGSADPLRLTTDSADEQRPRWSPNGQWIAFLRGRPNEDKGVYVIPAPFGGRERQIGTAQNMSVLDWSSDGKWLVISRRSAGNGPIGLALLSLDTRVVKQLTFPPAGNHDYGAAFAPKVDVLAFLRNAAPLILPLTSTLAPQGTANALPIKSRSSLRDLVWSEDGRDVLFSSGDGENSTLWRASASGAPNAQWLRFAGEGVFGPSISRNGKRLVFERYSHESNIWSLDLDRNGLATGSAVKAFDSSKTEICPRFSPDGSRVAFESGRSGNSEIWVCDSDGSNCDPLTSFGDTHAGSPAWSYDGDWIAFDVFRQSKSEIYIVNANGGQPRLLKGASGLIPRWSADGKWIYYRCGPSPLLVEMAEEMFDEVHICKVPAAGGEPVDVTRSGGAVAEESPDQKWIYYSGAGAAGRTSLRRIRTDGGGSEEVLREISGRNFAVVEEGIWYLTPQTSEGSLLQFFDFASKTSRTVYRIGQPVDAGLTISKDRRRILFTQVDRPATYDLMLVEGFH